MNTRRTHADARPVSFAHVTMVHYQKKKRENLTGNAHQFDRRTITATGSTMTRRGKNDPERNVTVSAVAPPLRDEENQDETKRDNSSYAKITSSRLDI